MQTLFSAISNHLLTVLESLITHEEPLIAEIAEQEARVFIDKMDMLLGQKYTTVTPPPPYQPVVKGSQGG